MNYYNPYFYTMPTTIPTSKTGLFSRLFGRSGITLGGILNGTQRVLNFANQAIPFVKQVRPMIGNAKTMFKVMNEFKRNDKSTQTNNNTTNIDNSTNIIEKTDDNVQHEYVNNNQGPTFFM